jgi:hypothetical protein
MEVKIMPVVTVPVRNMSKTNVVFSIPNSKDSVAWGYCGIPDGSDFQELPEEMWGSMRLRAARNNGVLAETTMEELEAALEVRRNARFAKEADRAAMVDATMTTPNQREIVIDAATMERHLEVTAQRRDSGLIGQIDEGILEDARVRAAAAVGTSDPANLASL